MIRKIFSIFNLEKNKLIYFSLLGLDKILILCFQFYFVNYLSSESYGIFSQTNYLSSVFQNLFMFGVAIPFIVHASNSKISFKFFYSFFVPSSILTALIALITVLIFGDFFSNFFYGNTVFFKYLIILLIVLISDIVSEYLIVSNRLNNKLLKHSKFIILRSFIKVSSLVIIYFVFEDFYKAFLVSSILYLIYSCIYFHKTVKVYAENFVAIYHKHKNEINKLWIEGFKFIIIYIITTTSTLLINLLIINQFDIDTLAIYNFNFMIASAPLTLVGYVTFYSLPDFSQKYSKSLNLKESNLFKDILFTSLIFILFFITVFLLYDYIILFAEDFYSNKTLFLIVFISNFIFMINNFLQFPLLSKKKYVSLILILGISLILNISYLSFISKEFSIITPVVGFLIANISTMILLIISHIRFNK